MFKSNNKMTKSDVEEMESFYKDHIKKKNQEIEQLAIENEQLRFHNDSNGKLKFYFSIKASNLGAGDLKTSDFFKKLD